MRTLLALILGIAIGCGVYWYYENYHQPASTTPNAAGVAEDPDRIRNGRDRAVEFQGEDIREEMERSGGVVQRKARETGAQVADATDDIRVTATIKGKLALDEELSAVGIWVNTTDGVVTLSGRVAAYEHIGRAIDLAMNTDGVREVISTLQVSTRRTER